MLESLRTNPPTIIQTPKISGIQETEIPQAQFLQTISKVTFQKWYSIVKFIVKDFSVNTVALINSGADQNYIQRGIFLMKYCKRTKE